MAGRHPLILAIDQGTHASKAMLFDRHGRTVYGTERAVSLNRISTECVEQDAEEILIATQSVIKDAVLKARAQSAEIAAAGLATQRSTVLAWDRATGKALSPALSWQDTRAAGFLSTLSAHAEFITQRTGLRMSPHYGGSKLRWLLDHVPQLAAASGQDRLCLGPLASFLIFRLTEGAPFLVDQANAGRSLLLNLDSRDWDPRLLDLFGLDVRQLPQVLPIRKAYGLLAQHGIPLCAVNGDQGAAVFGNTAREKCVVINFGSGAFVLGPPDALARRHPQLLTSLIDSDTNSAQFCLEGTINGAGAALDWLAQRAGEDSSGLELEPPRDDLPVFINTVGGLGSPWWRPGGSPYFLDTEPPADYTRRRAAVLESILFLAKTNLDLIRSAGGSDAPLRISGGLTRIPGFAQRLADLTECAVDLSLEPEATCRGIAWIAAGLPEHWTPPQVQTLMPKADPALALRYARCMAELDLNP